MDALPFDKPGRFYKGNLHTHSTSSDGALAPEEVVAAYREANYDFVAITDHFLERFGFPVTDTGPLATGDFATIVGAELHAPGTEVDGYWHIVAVGLPVDFSPNGEDETGPDLARRAREAGAFVGMAHPAWYGLTLEDAESLTAAHAVEVYNETTAQLNDRGDSWYACDALLGRGHRVYAYAADDAHFSDRPDNFAAWVQVRTETLESEALLAALKAGHFYSSQGPEIHDISIDDGHIAVSCSPAHAVFVSGRGAASQRKLGGGITSCRFSIEPFSGSYCRITVMDEADRRAWSNPIWLD